VRLACKRHLEDLRTERKKRLSWELELANHAIAFFPANLCFEDGRPFVLEPFQEFIVGSLFGWYTADGYRRFRTAYIEQGKGNGKALAIDTPVPTPTGWSLMRELQIGDEVFDEAGAPCRVVGVTEEMHGRPCYEVVFDDGAMIVADAGHLWFTEQRKSGRDAGAATRGVARNARGGWRRGLRTTAQIAASLRYSNGDYQSANHSVPLAGALETLPAQLPVDPYVLGFWLGDGDSDCARVTIGDTDAAESISLLSASGCAVGQRRGNSSGRAGRYRIGGVGIRGEWGKDSLNAKLRALGLLKNKHIPAPFLRGSALQRLALLQGLMDTDGYIDEKSGQCEFTSMTIALAHGVLELAISLGIKATCNRGRATIDGRDVGEKYRVEFFPPHGLAVFCLARKATRQYKRHARRRLSGERRITECRPVPSVPVKCIQVSAPSGMYLAGREMVPTHNSPLAAGVGLLGLLFDGLSSAEIYSAAVTQDQAGIIFKDAKRMVETSNDLRAEVEVLTNNLRAHGTNSIFRAVSAEHKSLDGKRVHMGLIDELHEHPHGLVVQKIRAGTKRDRNALIFEITNAGHDKTSVCWHHHDYSEKILTGVEENEAWFAYVCELDAGDSWKDPKVWPKANPGLGTILPREYLEEQVKEAKGMPSSENLVRRLNFCEWLEGATKWLDMEAWAKCGPQRQLELLSGKECFLALDLATTTDFAAEALFFPDEGEEFDLHVRFWLPEAAKTSAKRTERDRRNLIEWGAGGWIQFTPGNVTDYDFIEAQTKRDLSMFHVKALPFDRWNSTQLITHLKNDGAPVVEFGQGFASMSGPTKQFERLVKRGAIRHGNNPVLRWMAANTCVRTDSAENLKPDKEASAERIDGIVAAIMALGAWMNQEKEEGPPPPSVYEEREPIVV
jgi:phage terminase large subunit-like protein